MEKEFRFSFWAPLLNFELGNASIELGHGTSIRELSAHEKNIIEKLRKYWPEAGYQKFRIECIIAKKEPEPEPGLYLNDAEACLEKALTVLRLFGEAIVGFNLILQPLSNEPAYGASAQYFRNYQLWSGIAPNKYTRKYEIPSGQLEMFRTFFTDYYGLDFERIRLAVDYFNKSYIEPYIRDSLLDLVICLENLYLKKEEPELKAYKLRLRASYILAEKLEERKEIFENLKQAYNLRSQIVHGDKIPDIDHTLVIKIRGYARESMKKFIQQPSLAKPTKLDDVILRGQGS